jgi:hypothetical protein
MCINCGMDMFGQCGSFRIADKHKVPGAANAATCCGTCDRISLNRRAGNRFKSHLFFMKIDRMEPS